MISYTKAGTYTFPSDGYVYNESGTAISGYISGSNSNSTGLYLYPRLRLFVKKGMQYVYQDTSCTSGFIPLE